MLLRVALRQRDALPQWRKSGVSTALVLSESLRTLDRLRLRASLPDAEVARRRSTILALIGSLEILEIDATVLDGASQPMPTGLGTLDAIHLATALLWTHMTGVELVMATHDAALAHRAQAHECLLSVSFDADWHRQQSLFRVVKGALTRWRESGR